MYEYIQGKVTFVSPKYIVLETNGVGYQIQVGQPFQYQEAQTALVYVYLVVREDTQVIYGFRDLAEKQLFLRLLSVTGIGPKSALAIIAAQDPTGLIQAIEQNDVKYLTRFPGVGKKTAQQMILDLQGKLIAAAEEADTAAPETAGTQQALGEALEALKALGYSAREVAQVARQLEKHPELQTTDEFLRVGLKVLLR